MSAKVQLLIDQAVELVDPRAAAGGVGRERLFRRARKQLIADRRRPPHLRARVAERNRHREQEGQLVRGE